MFVNGIKITNFRCFADLQLGGFSVPDGSPASGLNLLIGENSNGKTTFLEAVNLLTQSSYTAGNILDVGDFTDMGEKLMVEYTSSTTFRCKMPETYRGCYYDADGLTFGAKVRDKRSPGRLLSPPILAELARTDAHRFRVLVPDSDATKALRALTRAREDLVSHRVAGR